VLVFQGSGRAAIDTPAVAWESDTLNINHSAFLAWAYRTA
jgi:hypothetical protein